MSNILEEAKKYNELQEECKKDFFENYNKAIDEANLKLAKMKEVFDWILKNEKSKNFLLNDGKFGKKAKIDFDKLTEDLRIWFRLEHYLDFYALSLKSEVSFKYNKINFYNKNQTDFAWFKINLEISKYSNLDNFYITSLKKISYEDSIQIEKKYDELINQMKELKKEARTLIDGFENVLNVFCDIEAV